MTRPEPLPAGEEKAIAVRQMFDTIAPRYDLVNRVMTFGLDIGWRRKAVRDLALPLGSPVADVACGTGDFCRELDEQGLVPVGLDYSFGMLAKARTEAPLVQADGLKLPLRDASVRGITCGFALRNVIDIDELFAEFARVTDRHGRIALLEVAQPRSAIVRAGHHAYFHRVVPLLGGLLSDKAAYSYLPRSTAYLPPTPTLLTMLESHGFRDARGTALGLGAAQLITATRI